MTATAPRLASDEFMLRCGMAVVVRDLAPADASLYPAFHERVSARDRRLRFFSPAPVRDAQIRGLTRYRPADAAVRAAIGRDDGMLYGVGRLHRIAGTTGEFAVMVRSDVKGMGLGRVLLEQALEWAPTLGITHVVGLILPENAGMLALVRELGFALEPDPEERGVLRAALRLPTPEPTPAAA